MFVCAGTADGCLVENWRISANLSPALHYKTLDFDETHFLKEKFKNHRSFPLSQFIGPSISFPGHHSFPMSWHLAVVQEGLMEQGQGREAGAGLSPVHKHSEISAKRVLPCSKFAHSLSRNSSNLSKWNTIKPGRRRKAPRSQKWHHANFRFGNWFICQLIGTHT